ncbi:sulfatase-like hydrolase/transferase [Planctomycetota bacterium]
MTRAPTVARPGRAERVFLVALWCLGLALLLTAARIAIVVGFRARDMPWPEACSLLLAVPGFLVCGLPFALLLFSSRSRHRAFGWTLLLPFVLGNVFAFHYEAASERLLSAGAMCSLTPPGAAGTLLAAVAPTPWILAELLTSVVLLWALVTWVCALVRNGRTRTRTRAWISGLVIGGSLIVTGAVQLSPHALSPALLWGSRTPWLWLIRTVADLQPLGSSGQAVTRDDVWHLQRQLGHSLAFGDGDARYPLRAIAPRNRPRPGNGRSVILLVLESVGAAEAALVVDGVTVMPNLGRIAREGLHFRSFLAAGTTCVHALPSLFAGIPPQTAGPLLRRSPLANLEGIPQALRRKGYGTAYFHGGHLDMDSQRAFLTMVGFEELVEPDVTEEPPMLSWGLPDEYMFEKLTAWIHRRRSGDGQPFLAALATISSRAPYLLPDRWERRFAGDDPVSRYVECLRYLDHQLGAFYGWYVREEAPRGTLLVLVGDHPPQLVQHSLRARGEPLRFDVPLVLSGRSEKIGANLGERALRRGAMFDIPATICELLDVEQMPGDQGLSLLRAGPGWPGDRVLYTVAGDSCEQVYVFSGEATFSYEHSAGVLRRLGSAEDAGGRRAGVERSVGRFVDGLLRVNAYLYDRDAYAPAIEREVAVALPVVARPMVISHRGQTDGALPAHEQNKLTAVEHAIASGYRFFEVDVNLTQDGVPVLVHDSAVLDGEGQPRLVARMTLDQLRELPSMADVATLNDLLSSVGDRVNLVVELKPQGDKLHDSVLGTAVLRALRRRRGRREIIVDSFDPFLATLVHNRLGIAAGLDLPQHVPVIPAVLENIRRRNLDWVVVHHRVLSSESVRLAHRLGLRVMAYGVDDVASLERLAPELPDGVITADHKLLEQIRSRWP